MRDPVLMAARDPSCLMCLTPNDGGGWFSPLRQGVAWPSPMPRNFATEPEAAWREFYRASAEIGTHDYTRELVVRIDDTDGIIWGDSAGQAVFYAERSGQSIRLCMQPGTANYSRLTVPDISAGVHKIVWRRVATAASYSLDGVEIFSVPAVTGNTQWTTRAIPRSTTGTILSDTLRDETSGRTVWNYPNEAERLRLITKTNIRADRGIFEPATGTAVTRISTPIDLRGNSSSLTLVCKAYIPSHAPDGKLYASGLINQGAYLDNVTTCGFYVWEDYRGGSLRQIRLNCIDESGTQRTLYFTSNDNSIFDRFAVFTAVFDYERSLMLQYVDGVEVARQSVPLTAFGQGGTAFVDTVFVMHNTSAAFLSRHEIAYAMIFKRALSAAEILGLK